MIQDLHHNSYHLTILGCLSSATAKEHQNYLEERILFLLWPPTSTKMQEDTLFYDVQDAIMKPTVRDNRRDMWILEDMWTLVNIITALRRDPTRDQSKVIHLGLQVKTSLHANRKSRT